MCGCLSCGAHWGPGPQPGMCPDWESNPGESILICQAALTQHNYSEVHYIIA